MSVTTPTNRSLLTTMGTSGALTHVGAGSPPMDKLQVQLEWINKHRDGLLFDSLMCGTHLLTPPPLPPCSSFYRIVLALL